MERLFLLTHGSVSNNAKQVQLRAVVFPFDAQPRRRLETLARIPQGAEPSNRKAAFGSNRPRVRPLVPTLASNGAFSNWLFLAPIRFMKAPNSSRESGCRSCLAYSYTTLNNSSVVSRSCQTPSSFSSPSFQLPT